MMKQHHAQGASKVPTGRQTLWWARGSGQQEHSIVVVRGASSHGDTDESNKEGGTNSATNSTPKREPTTQQQQPRGRVVSGPGQPLPVKGMKLERVERLGGESWAGVANVDRGQQGLGFKNVLALVGGDTASLLLFATIGRLSHGEPLSLIDSFGTALPFMVGWFTAAVALGGYGKPALESSLKTAATCWITGIPAGLLLRSISRGYLPETPFIVISMAVTGVFLMGWRRAYVAVADPLESSLNAKEQLQRRTNRQGNPFEFISLLISLVKRW